MNDQNKTVGQSIEDASASAGAQGDRATDDTRTVIVDPSIMQETDAHEGGDPGENADKEVAPAKLAFSGPAKVLAAVVAIAMILALVIGALVINAQPSRADKLSVPQLPVSDPDKEPTSTQNVIGIVEPRGLDCRKCSPESLVFDHRKGTVSCPASCSEYEYDQPAK